MATNNSLNNQCLNDFTVTRSNSGGTNLLLVTNTSDTASSVAMVRATVAGTSAGDAVFQAVVTSGSTWTWGADNSDSDSWKLNPSSSIGTSDVLQMTTAGVASMPLSGSALYIGTSSPTVPSALNVEKSSSGSAVEIEVRNSSDTASSSAVLGIAVGGTSGGDAYVTYNVPATTNWSHGIDNSDSDKFIISASSALGTTNVMQMTVAGEITMPLQSAFLATHTVDQLNQTGNGTIATINYTTEVVDQNSDYDGTNTYTCPVTAQCQFGVTAYCSDVAGATLGRCYIVTSNRSYQGSLIANVAAAGAWVGDLQISLADMDAADTCISRVSMTGIGADTADLPGDAVNAYWSGCIQC